VSEFSRAKAFLTGADVLLSARELYRINRRVQRNIEADPPKKTSPSAYKHRYMREAYAAGVDRLPAELVQRCEDLGFSMMSKRK